MKMIKCFVAMPYGSKPDDSCNEWTILYDQCLKQLEKKITGLPQGISHDPIEVWRADRGLEGLALKENVIHGIDNSAIFLCVLTQLSISEGGEDKYANPNVLWELGFAECLGIPIVILADKMDLNKLPVLAGFQNVCPYDHKILEKLRDDFKAKIKDTTKSGQGNTGSLSKQDCSRARKELRHIAKELVPYINQARREARRVRIGSCGMARFYPDRDGEKLRNMIIEAENQVDILTTNTHYFMSEEFLGKELKEEIDRIEKNNSNPDNKPISDDPHPFKMALENGVAIRIVTMDPESVIAEYRAKQLVKKQDIPGYRSELRKNIVKLYRRYGRYSDFHLNIYNDLPLQITTRIDDIIFTSVVTRGERARKRIQIKFNLYDEGVTESFVSHFQSMFDNSHDVSGYKWVTNEDDDDLL